MERVLLFETESNYAADVVTELLEQAAIPYYRHQETVMYGVMSPRNPDTFGQLLRIYVQEDVLDKAWQKIQGLPFVREAP